MRSLSQLDLIIVAVYLLLIFAAGMVLTRRASSSVDDFFIGGRHMPWWLIGISMAATNFSIDTPVSLTNFIRTEGISGVWFFWAGAISARVAAAGRISWYKMLATPAGLCATGCWRWSPCLD